MKCRDGGWEDWLLEDTCLDPPTYRALVQLTLAQAVH